MNRAPFICGILASVFFVMAVLYAFLGPSASPPDLKFVLLLAAASAAIGTVLGTISVVRRKRAGQRQNRLTVVGLETSAVILVLIVGLALLTIRWIIGLDNHNYAREPLPVDASVGFIEGPYETRTELSFRTLDWSCQPDGGDSQNLDGSGSGYVCLLDFEASASGFGDNRDDSSTSPPEQSRTVNSLDQRVVDRCYRRSQGGPFRRSEGCSSPQHSYAGYADRERKYEAWDLGYRAESGTCLDQPVSLGTSVVCQSLFRVPELPDFVSYGSGEIGGGLLLLPGVEVTPPTTTPTLP